MNTQMVQPDPDWMKTSKPTQAFAALDPTESLGEGIGGSYGVLGYKGKIWSLRHRGENHILLRPDDGTPAGYIDVIILRQAKVKAKSFYPGGFDEHGSMGKRPDCASIDGVRPDPDVTNKQSELCATCPKNEWHTDQNGRKTRDCTDYKRLSVLMLPPQTVRLFGQALMEPVFLRVPPDSLNDLATFGDHMANQGWHFSSFVTRITFDSAKSHPKFVFKAVQALGEAEAATVLGIREDALAKRITGEDEIARRATLALANGSAPSPAVPAATGLKVLPSQPPVAPANPNPYSPAGSIHTSDIMGVTGTFRPAPPTAASQQAVQTTTTQQDGPNPSLLGFTAPVTPPPAAPPPQTLDLAAQGGGAFGLAPPPPPAATSAPPGAMVGQTAEDVGTAVDNPDLDAQIMAMLAT